MLRIRTRLLEGEGRCETWQPPHLVWPSPRSLFGFPKIRDNNKGSFAKVNEEERRPFMMKAIRILIADDHPVVRRGVRTLLETRDGWSVCGEARTGEEALERVRILKPDILIMDLSMPGMRGFEAIRKIHEFNPNLGIVTLTIHDTESMFRGAMEAGAHAYVLKSDLDGRLMEAVEALCENREFFSPGITQTVLKSCVDDYHDRLPASQDPEVLTPRQLQVLRLVARGNSNKEVASILGISNRTVEAHRYQIMSRLHASTLSDLVIFAVRNKLIST